MNDELKQRLVEAGYEVFAPGNPNYDWIVTCNRARGGAALANVRTNTPKIIGKWVVMNGGGSVEGVHGPLFHDPFAALSVQ